MYLSAAEVAEVPPTDDTVTSTVPEPEGEVAVIDPGPDMPDHLDAILAATAGERVSHILITHHHADHVGGIEAPPPAMV